MGLCLIKTYFYWNDPIKFRGCHKFYLFFKFGYCRIRGVVLVEWFIDFLRLCAVKSVHQGKAGAEFCGGGKRVTEVIELTTSRKLRSVTRFSRMCNHQCMANWFCC
mgnify:CR=1 FL=1